LHHFISGGKFSCFDHINLKNGNAYWESSLWVYMGEPVVCENCGDFCKQKCKRKL